MRALQGIGNLGPVSHEFIDRQRSANEAIRERFAFDEFHDQKLDVALFPDVVKRANVRMRKRGDDARFTLKTQAHLAIARPFRRDDLQRNET